MAGSSHLLNHPCPKQRWQIAPPQPEQVATLAQALQLHPLLAQVLLNRGINTTEAAQVFLNPELQILPSPLDEFEDLPIALELLLRAIAERQFIAICGDYDADGMTSTALLLRALRFLGATVDYAIPSRMQEGYGINRRIVEALHQEGVGLILTVDNGIAAVDPITYARELGIAVIVTDHHDIPPTLPPANAILNPKLIREDSPYRGVAGVGAAYILAVCLAQSLQKTQDLTTPLIELFTLGTIADLAPLTGVNRRWVKRGLKLLPKSKITGIQALIQVAGLSNEKALKPEAVGFRLGPRINAIGRISDPQIVIELLTTDDEGRALDLAMKCEQVNQLRQRLCELIEQEAIAWCCETHFEPQKARVLVIVQPEWHHGVIGIVASRLVERYGVPVFIGTFENTADSEADTTEESEDIENILVANQSDEPQANLPQADSPQTHSSAIKIRGSARGIPEFDVFEALQFCGDLLEKFGGHKAAGGFTFAAENLEAFRLRLEQFASQSLRPEHLKPLVNVDVRASFRDLTLELFERLDILHPCGIENPDPVFWTPDVHVVEQRTIGRDQAHLKLTLAEVTDPTISIRAVAWRWGSYYPLPDYVDVAYRLRLNEWNGVRSVELELVGIRLAGSRFAESLSESSCESSSEFDSDIASQNKSPKVEKIAQKSIQKSILSIPDVQPVESYESQAESDFEAEDGFLSNSERINYPTSSDQSSYQTGSSPISPFSFAGYQSTRQSTKFSSRSNLIRPQRQSSTESLEVESCFNVGTFSTQSAPNLIEFYYGKRKYTGGVYRAGNNKELRINNDDGQLLVIQPEQRRGFLGQGEQITEEIDVSQPHYFNLVRSALMAMELAEKTQLIAQQEKAIAAKDQEASRLRQQLVDLQQQIEQLRSVRSSVESSVQSTEVQSTGAKPNIYASIRTNVQSDSQSDQFDGTEVSGAALLTEQEIIAQLKPSIAATSVSGLDLTSDPAPNADVATNSTQPSPTTEPELQAIFAALSDTASAPAATRPTDPKQRLKADLGETVWNALDSRSQKDLVAAYKKLTAIQTEAITADFDQPVAIDYSDVALRLCSVVEREVIQPFFKQLHQFLLENNEPCEIGGVTLRSRKKYTLGMLPPLLSETWYSFTEEALSCSRAPDSDQLLVQVIAPAVDENDRNTVEVFLSQWEYPLSLWLQNETAASTIAQIDRLLTIAADADNPLYEWQYEQLQTLILGTDQQTGMLRQIYG